MDHSELAEALRRRMHVLSERFPQAEIARRTGSTRNNVSRYLRGTRMPLEFGSALVKGVGVNPAWLLTGEGATWLSDTTVDTSRMAGDLLDLVNAMTAVSRMKLGELAGKENLRTLRELDDALRSHDALRAKLNERTRPVFRELLSRYQNALKDGELGAADHLRRALEQMSRLCDDAELTRHMIAMIAGHQALTGDLKGNLASVRETFKRELLAAQRMNRGFALTAMGYASACQRAGLAGEGRQAARMALTMCDGADPSWEALLQCALGLVEMEGGNLHDGLKRAAGNIMRVDAADRHRVVNIFLRGMLLSGSLSLTTALQTFAGMDVRAHQFVPFAAWTEERKGLETVCRDFIGEGVLVKPDAFEAGHARAVLAALKGDSQVIEEFTRRHLPARRKVERQLPGNVEGPVAEAQVLRLCGKKAPAREAALETANRLAAMPPEYTPNTLTHAVHCRNVLVLVPAGTKDAALRAERNRAEAWIRDMFKKGYTFLEPLLKDTA